MTRTLLLLAMVVGCSEEGPITEPHELGDCDGWPNSIKMCERACKKEQPQIEGGCPAKLREDITNGNVDCTNGTFTLEEGFHGCCITGYLGHETEALFAECTQ